MKKITQFFKGLFKRKHVTININIGSLIKEANVGSSKEDIDAFSKKVAEVLNKAVDDCRTI